MKKFKSLDYNIETTIKGTDTKKNNLFIFNIYLFTCTMSE